MSHLVDDDCATIEDIRLALCDGWRVTYQNKPVRAVNGALCICYPDTVVSLTEKHLSGIVIYPKIKVYNSVSF